MMSPTLFRPLGARRKKSPHADTPSDSESLKPVTHGYFETRDGTRLFYCTEGQGAPLVFCYGLVCSSLHWTYQLDYFRENYQCIWFDYRAHQKSDRPEDLSTLNIPQFSRDLQDLLEHLQIKRAFFLGHSMGVNVVLETYRESPELFAGMVLASGTARAPLESLFNISATRGILSVLKKTHQWFPKTLSNLWKLQQRSALIKAIVRFGGFNPFLTPQEDIDLYVNQVLEMDPEVFIRVLENYDRFDSQAWLHTVHTPSLIIAGDQDHLVPLDQQRVLHQLIPGSQWELLRNGSHCPQMDLPELFNLRVEKFLTQIGYTSP